MIPGHREAASPKSIQASDPRLNLMEPRCRTQTRRKILRRHKKPGSATAKTRPSTLGNEGSCAVCYGAIEEGRDISAHEPGRECLKTLKL